MKVDWEKAREHVARLEPVQQAYWTLVLERLGAIEFLDPEAVAARLDELHAIAPIAEVDPAKDDTSSTERLVRQLSHQLADQLSWNEGLAVSKLSDPTTENRAGLWQTLHAARRRLEGEKPADPKLDKSTFKQAMPSEELCIVWRCLAGLLVLEEREAVWVKKWRLELSQALEGAKTARGKRLRKLDGDIAGLMTNEERSRFLIPAGGCDK